jgi:phosphatidylserine decarboxylase
MGMLSELRAPSALLGPAIRAYSFGVGVDTDGVMVPPGGFTCFGDFFARRLEPEARPLPVEDDILLCPSDGKLASFGFVEKGRNPTFLIKGYTYDLSTLLGSAGSAARFSNGGGYAVNYLHPRDYHRVHSPAACSLLSVRHIPGTRYPVAPWSERRIEGIYGKNERMVFELELPGGAPVTLVMVAAYGVSNIASDLAPEPDRISSTERAFDPPAALAAGEDIAAFRLGSTVVLLWGTGAVELEDDLTIGRVLMGQRLGRILPATIRAGLEERKR